MEKSPTAENTWYHCSMTHVLNWCIHGYKTSWEEITTGHLALCLLHQQEIMHWATLLKQHHHPFWQKTHNLPGFSTFSIVGEEPHRTVSSVCQLVAVEWSSTRKVIGMRFCWWGSGVPLPGNFPFFMPPRSSLLSSESKYLKCMGFERRCVRKGQNVRVSCQCITALSLPSF